MYAVVDIGNSFIKAARFKSREEFDHGRWELDDLEGFERWLAFPEVDHILISSTASVRFDITPSLPQAAERMVLDMSTELPIRVDYDRSGLGQDRIADAVGGHTLDPRACLVIDMGTCITYNLCVQGEFLGGGISPGWLMRHKAMSEFTGRLPMVGPETFDGIAKDTEQALKAGAFQGIRSEIDALVSEFRSTYADGTCILTGGDSLTFEPHLENHIFADPFHTLKGLYDILVYNIP